MLHNLHHNMNEFNCNLDELLLLYLSHYKMLKIKC